MDDDDGVNAPGGVEEQGQELRHLGFKLSMWSSQHPKHDHDHCEICGCELSNRPGADFGDGFVTVDHEYLWLCGACFERHQSRLHLRQIE